MLNVETCCCLDDFVSWRLRLSYHQEYLDHQLLGSFAVIVHTECGMSWCIQDLASSWLCLSYNQQYLLYKFFLFFCQIKNNYWGKSNSTSTIWRHQWLIKFCQYVCSKYKMSHRDQWSFQPLFTISKLKEQIQYVVN